MQVIAIIPARGGSVGVARKNVRELGGLPLIAHSIEQALAADWVSRVVVTTDDDEIATVSRRYGAEVVRRPAQLANATATSESALTHALDSLRESEGYEPDLVVFLQCTSPFRRPSDIDDAVRTLLAQKADSLFSCGPSHGFVWRIGASGPRAVNYDPARRQRRQDAPEDVVENGSIYVLRPWVLRRHDNRLGGVIATHRMRAVDSFQVDEPDDLELMRGLIARRTKPDLEPFALAGLSLVMLDFDGVLTDNRVYVDQHGVESVACSRGDSWGIARLREAGIEVLVVSTETNPVVAARCAKLRIDHHAGIEDKGAVVRALLSRRGLAPSAAAFVGNDVNDLGAMASVGLPIAVADATPAARAAAAWVTRRIGGDGAVREVADAIVEARGALRTQEQAGARHVA